MLRETVSGLRVFAICGFLFMPSTTASEMPVQTNLAFSGSEGS
ncbi:MAG: hypothetical protein EOP53_16135 [Sphingobacteriales bacterium]|nr:MAG: hypothetical protein EOP53_16135 [Sphingobacteriales bacterium]